MEPEGNKAKYNIGGVGEQGENMVILGKGSDRGWMG